MSRNQNNQSKLQDKINQMKNNATQPDKKKVIDGIVNQEPEKPDFEKMAAELQERHKKEAKSLNDGYVKDTIYIREDLYKALNALVLRRGMKKELINEAIADFVIKKYKELQRKKK